MYIVTVTIFVKPEFLEPFIAATLDNAQNTRKEPKNLRFDVSQAETEPTRFLLYEVYQSKEDFAAHHQTAHYLRWKDTVANVVQFIETKQHQFYTKEGNASAWVGVRTSAAGRKFLQTYADCVWKDNLLALPECS